MMCGDWESYVYLCTYFLKEVGELPILLGRRDGRISWNSLIWGTFSR